MQKNEGMKKELKEEEKEKERNEKKTKQQFFKRRYKMHHFPLLLGLEPMPLDS